jgi:hypothetical protein
VVWHTHGTSCDDDDDDDDINHLTPNGHFSVRTAPLTSRRWFYIFI